MGCCISRDEDDECILSCDNNAGRTFWQVMLDLMLYTMTGGLTLLQLLLVGSRLDEFTFHDQYTIPSSSSWYLTFWPTFVLMGFFLIMCGIWFNAAGKMKSSVRRSCTLSLAAISFYLIFTTVAFVVMLCGNLNVYSHNYAARALRRHNITGNLPPNAVLGGGQPLKLWDDDEGFLNVFYDPTQQQGYPYSWFMVSSPWMIASLLILVYGIINWLSQNSQKSNIATLCCSPELDADTMAEILNMNGHDDHDS